MLVHANCRGKTTVKTLLSFPVKLAPTACWKVLFFIETIAMFSILSLIDFGLGAV